MRHLIYSDRREEMEFKNKLQVGGKGARAESSSFQTVRERLTSHNMLTRSKG